MLSSEQPNPDSLYIPPVIKLPYVRRLGEIAATKGFAAAVTEVFDDAGIDITVEGDLSPADGQGLIIAGGHRQRIEPVLVQGMMDVAGRDASHVIAAPASYAGRQIQASGPQGKELIIPVISGMYVAERPLLRSSPRDIVRRHLYPHALNRPRHEAQEINRQAIAKAAGVAAGGGTVTIFPIDHATDPSNPQWRSGLANIIQSVPEEARDTTQVAVMQPDTFSVRRVMSALALSSLRTHHLGRQPERQEIILRSRIVGSVSEILDGVQPPVTSGVTAKVREVYEQHFDA